MASDAPRAAASCAIANQVATMLTFFDYLPSQNAFKVRLLLHHLQIPHQSEFVSIFAGEGKTPAYLQINPTGAVPAIRLDDGRTLAESNAILTYLAEDSVYLPSDRFGRAKVNQWLSFEQDYVQNTIGSLRYWVMTSKAEKRPVEVVESKRNAGMKALGILDHELSLRPFICGEHYTVADMSMYAYASQSEDAGIPLAPFAHFKAWVARVESQTRFLGEIHPYSIDPLTASELQ
jgi:glutathione S-transferase